MISLALLMLAGTLWTLLAPVQWGGRMAYLTVLGASMEPNIHRGDLIVLRDAADYRVGDVVAYRNPERGAAFLHRIVAEDGERYVLKGDNNSWRDSYEPTKADILGRMRLRVPGAGNAMTRLRDPLTAELLSGALGAIVLGRGAIVARRRRRRGEPAAASPLVYPSLLGPVGQMAVGLLVASAAGLGALAFISSRSAPMQTVSRDVPYSHDGAFTYEGSAPAGAVYPAGKVASGDPAFFSLVDSMALTFSYEFNSQGVHQMNGMAHLVAELSDDSGWRSPIELSPWNTFSGDRAIMTGSIDFTRVLALLREVDSSTGVYRDHYNLAVLPEVRVQGTVAGQPLQEKYAPRLLFRLDQYMLRLERSEAALAAAGGDSASSLNQSRGGSIKAVRQVPTNFGALGLEAPVSTVRRVSLAGAVAVAIPAIGGRRTCAHRSA